MNGCWRAGEGVERGGNGGSGQRVDNSLCMVGYGGSRETDGRGFPEAVLCLRPGGLIRKYAAHG